MKPAHLLTLLFATAVSLQAVTPDGKQKLVFIAGKPSHPPGMHEFRAGTMLLEQCLKGVPNLVVDRHEMGWVSDEKTFEDADAVVIYADGGGRHPAVVDGHLETLRKLMAKGVGFGCMHYGVEVVAGQAGKEFQEWIGGYYENAYSCNPIWEASYNLLPKHPVTNGVQPFATKDEWYIHMRFRPAFGHGVAPLAEGALKFAPILVAVPTEATRNGPYVAPKGPYPHIQAERGSPETTMWTIERADGGRGFGFTGGHFHANWGDDNVRKTVLNALLWVSKVEVPADGVASTVTPEALTQNLDPKPAPKPKKAAAAETPRVFQRVATR
ncbi:MAG: ThuA domain-containing protein [Verrucomicrobia bacterium]|nr:ThuA domain-containing protein [Verrucomicrobiota bacterium]